MSMASKILYGVDNLKDVTDKNICIDCGGDASDFKNDISRKEYMLSGLCQKCQDEVFSDEED